MTEPTERSSNVLAVTLVVAMVFQIFLSVLILRELRSLPGKMTAGGVPTAPARGLEAGSEAPGFRLTDSRGREVSLADYRGRKVMLIFSSDQCKYCKQMYPELARFRSNGAASEVEVVMLQLGSTPEQNHELARAQGFDFPVLVANRETFQAYQVPGTPFSTVVDETGVITATGVISDDKQMAGLLGLAVGK